MIRALNAAWTLIALLMPNKLPLVQIACICEKVLREEDGTLSAIRIVDRFYMPDVPANMPADLKPVAALTAFLSLKSGDVKGDFEISVKLRLPSGETRPFPRTFPVRFSGEEQGQSIVLDMQLDASIHGYHELDVICDGSALATIPFRLGSVRDLPAK